MYAKNTQTVENHGKYLKSTIKNLQNTLFLKTPKWPVISGSSHFVHAKRRKNNTKSRRDGTRVFGVLKNKTGS
jgi:hypothetical protein